MQINRFRFTACSQQSRKDKRSKRGKVEREETEKAERRKNPAVWGSV